ncbi:SurA N-terminal domain-containing protein [Pistricoccus aurantiacus]|uniref:SurA N-terminal domain-containing protein n=1 Tax=Pistricoccus aurantiacus TaxID=1883414 RepID=UPI00363A912C
MLQSIRNRASSWGAKIIIGAIVVTLSLFGVESLVGLFSGGGDEVAKVNGEAITRQQVELEVQRAIRSGQVPADQERQLRRQVLDDLIDRMLIDQYVDEGGFHVSDDQLDQLIVTLPEFQDQDGRFSTELFRNRLASAGFTPVAFRQQLRVDVQRQQLQQGLAASAFSLSSEAERLATLQGQQRSFRYHLLTEQDLDAAPDVSAADLESYYQAHRDDYQRPEQVKLNYVIVDRQAMAETMDVDEQALRERYAERVANAERRVSHIMVTFGDERSKEQARERLEQVRERLAQGDEFADLAEEFSDDTSTSGEGGDLGVISRGFFGEEFENAAFSLDKGQVSNIVETDNGLHLLKVTDVELPPFEELRDSLRKEAALAASKDEFNERVQRLIDESFAADDLQSVADSVGVELQKSDWVSRDVNRGVLSEPGVMQAAFDKEVLEDGYNSEVIELDEDRRMVLRVAEQRPATTLAFEEVEDRVRQAVLAEKRRQALMALADSRLEALRDGETPEIDWQSIAGATRQNAEAPRFVAEAAFRLPAPANDDQTIYGEAVGDQGVALVALDEVSQGEVNSETVTGVSRLVERLRAQIAIAGLQEYLREEASIKRL